MSRTAFALTLVIVIGCLCLAAPARAQQSSENKAAADALFDEAKQLLAAGEIGKACAKLEASTRLADQLGTRLNLADCYERLGRTASAWAEFREAASLAAKRGDGRERFARERAEKLQARLVKLVIIVPPGSRVPGLAVRRDLAPVAEALYDTPVPVDPGKHTIDAAAEGFQPWSQEIEVGQEGQVRVELPRLTPAPQLLVIKTDPAEDTRRARKTRHLVGIAFGAAGIAALGTSLILGFEARSKSDDAQAYCNGAVCSPMGWQLNQDARSFSDTATIVAGIGAAALVTGTIIYLTAPKQRPQTEQPVVAVWPRQGGVSVGVQGSF